MRLTGSVSAMAAALACVALPTDPVIAHTGDTLIAQCTGSGSERLDTQADILMEIRCDQAGNIVLRVRAEGEADRVELFLDPDHTSVLDRPMHFILQDGELTVMQSIHKPFAVARAIPGGAEWTITLPESSGRIIGLGAAVATSNERVAWPADTGMGENRRKLGDLLLLQGDERASSLSGKVQWSAPRDFAPPMRIVAQSANARVESAVASDGTFALRLPAGSYDVFAVDSRIGLAREARSVIVDQDQMVTLSEPVTAHAASSSVAELVPAILDRAGVKAAAVAIVADGKTVFAQSYGVERDGDPAGPRTLFGMESVTKTVTAMTMLSMAERGLLDLDEPLAKYWTDPDLADDPRHRDVTFRMALRHLTTLPNWRGDDPLSFSGEPGSVQYYSGEGYEYARRALIRKFGRSLQDLAQSFVFGPAGTEAMSFLWPENGDEYAAGFHFGDYAFDFDKPTVEASAASDLVATAEDLGKYATWLANGGELSTESWARILTPNADRLRKADDASRIGEGFFVFDAASTGDLPVFGHGGSAMGARTLIVVDPEGRDAIAVATSSGAGLSVIRAVMEAAFKKGRDLPLLEEELSSWESYDY
mgnify:CR=1 FL=1